MSARHTVGFQFVKTLSMIQNSLSAVFSGFFSGEIMG